MAEVALAFATLALVFDVVLVVVLVTIARQFRSLLAPTKRAAAKPPADPFELFGEVAGKQTTS